MKIALLTRNPKLYSHQRLIQTAEARGHRIVPIDYLRCYMNITSRNPELRYKGEIMEGFDAVIPRIAASHTFYGLAVLRQFEMMGVYPLDEIVAIGRSRDKLRCLQLLARDGVGLPVTAFANSADHTNEVLEMVGGAPVVIKLLEGTQGIGVVLGETHKSAKSVIEAFHGAEINILVQEFINCRPATQPFAPVKRVVQSPLEMSVNRTFAPSARNSSPMARPIPPAAPVTIATLPCRDCSATIDLIALTAIRPSHPM